MHGTTVVSPTVSVSKMRDVPTNMADRLIVALDVPSPNEASALVDKLEGIVSFFKVGLWLLFAVGTDALIDKLVKRKKNVFLDYKMFDIAETVSRGIERARDRGIRFVTVHGYSEIIKAAVAAKGNSNFLKVFTITVLTSMDESDLEDMGYSGITVKQLIELRVKKALKYGSDGVIASPADNPNEIRRLVDNQGLLIATPGIRMEGASSDDHVRYATPSQAIRDGADYLIVGRPILKAVDPRSMAQRIIQEMEAGKEAQT